MLTLRRASAAGPVLRSASSLRARIPRAGSGPPSAPSTTAGGVAWSAATAPRAVKCAAIASTTTPDESAIAPTHAASGPAKAETDAPANPIAVGLRNVPQATDLVLPDLTTIPRRNVRYPIAAGEGRRSQSGP